MVNRNNKYWFVIFGFLALNLISCQPYDLQKKQPTGTYRVNFEGYEDEFRQDEILLYSDTYFHLNYDGSFTFSKIISNKSKKGKWWVHESAEFELITLKYDDGTYAEIGRCTTDVCLIKVKVVSNGKVKNLPFIKVRHEFPELFKG